MNMESRTSLCRWNDVSFLVPKEMGFLEGIGFLPLLLPIAIFLYFVTFSFSHSMSRWKKMWKWGFHMSETESKLLLDKNLQPGAPKPESNFPRTQDLYLQFERQN